MSELLFHSDDEEEIMCGMFGPKMGWWDVHSEKDPRWNNSGRARGLVCTGGPQELHDWIDECKKNYGDPPDDVRWSFMKD